LEKVETITALDEQFTLDDLIVKEVANHALHNILDILTQHGYTKMTLTLLGNKEGYGNVWNITYE
jgi:hypothetical protein